MEAGLVQAKSDALRPGDDLEVMTHSWCLSESHTPARCPWRSKGVCFEQQTCEGESDNSFNHVSHSGAVDFCGAPPRILEAIEMEWMQSAAEFLPPFRLKKQEKGMIAAVAPAIPCAPL
eukprot:scaffold98_cov244-Pinguiococcus_pyrenoidosus.AAC.2